jgi:hypothetical protein
MDVKGGVKLDHRTPEKQSVNVPPAILLRLLLASEADLFPSARGSRFNQHSLNQGLAEVTTDCPAAG